MLKRQEAGRLQTHSVVWVYEAESEKMSQRDRKELQYHFCAWFKACSLFAPSAFDPRTWLIRPV